MRKKLIIVGTSTTSARIYNFIKKHDLFDVIGFALDKSFIENNSFNNLPIYDLELIDTILNKDDDLLFVAMAWNRMNRDRKDTFLRLKSKGYNFANIISPGANIYGKIIGENCWIADNVVIETGAILDSNIIVDHNSYIGSFTQIGSHCYIGANSFIAGKCIISEQCFIGIRATIFDQVKIGKICLVGACTIVKRNIEDYTIIKTTINKQSIISSNLMEIENKLLADKNKR